MFTTTNKNKRQDRRAAVLVLAAILMIVMFAFLAFAVDLGYIALTHTQLQNAADSAALAAASYVPLDIDEATSEAQEFAGYEKIGGTNITPESVNVEFGVWDPAQREFTVTPSPGNAVRVSVERSADRGGQVPLFFGPVLGKAGFSTKATAVAMTNPRDICFVVDLSGSMNDDTEPVWTTEQINNTFGGGIGNSLMQDVYADFGFGTFPGTTQHVCQPLGIAQTTSAYATLSSSSGPLTSPSIPSFYRITGSDNTSAKRKIKAYRYMIDYQLAQIMPNALPTPNASVTASYNYWTRYLDYVIYPLTPGASSSYEITDFGNPQTNSYPEATVAAVQAFRNKLGYRTYVQFMMDYGRNLTAGGQKVPLSADSSYCPWHSESTDGGTFSFPPREQPTHAARRSIIAALKIIKDRNETVSDPNQRDWVSVITFDTVSGVRTLLSLTTDYDAAMQACTTMQAVGDDVASTATETGLIAGKNHIKSVDQGGQGRRYTNKVVVLLTDGLPNLKSSSNTTITNYIGSHPSSDWCGGSEYTKNAALMQCMAMQLQKWMVFPVGIGLGTDYDFMDRAARMGGTANEEGQSPRGSGNPAEYEQRLKDIFNAIISNPKTRLVQ